MIFPITGLIDDAISPFVRARNFVETYADALGSIVNNASDWVISRAEDLVEQQAERIRQLAIRFLVRIFWG